MNIRVSICFFICLFLANCGTKKVIPKKKPSIVIAEPTPKSVSSVNEDKHLKQLNKSNNKLNKSTLAYIKKYVPLAVNEMHQSKIPASITLAQGILESGNGKSQLASKANNHFGIKCHKNWKGQRIYYDDDEKGECFRKYQFVATSFRDHSDFLSKRKRYAFLFKYNRNDYKKWARGLKKSGYATDKKYSKKLISIIENYELYKFDTISNKTLEIPKEETKKVIVNVPIKIPIVHHIVTKGDTLYSLARKFNTTVDILKEMNNLESNQLSIGQLLIVKK